MKTNNALHKSLFVFALLYLGYVISYIDRAAISLALSHIGEDFHLGAGELGVVLSAFYLGYAVMQIPGGWLADRFGAKWVVVVSIALWSVFTLMTGLAWSLASLLVIRFLFGLGEGSYPSAAVKGVAELYTRADRPKMTSLLISSNYTGSFAAPLIITPLLVWLGWRDVFLAIGVAGILFALGFAWLVKRPEAYGNYQSHVASGSAGKVDAKVLLRMPLLWKIVLVWFSLGLVNKGLDAWMPMYLLTARGLDLKTVGMLVPLPFITASIASAMGGWLMTRYFDGREKLLMTASCALTGLFLYGMYQSQSTTEVITYQAIVYFFKSFVFATAFALPTKILAQRLVGTGIGMVNFGGQVAGFVSPMVIGFLVAHYGTYESAFLFLLCATVAATLISLSISDRKVLAVQQANMHEA
ncbi:MFS transporter [Pseudomonas sp. DTU_2021_1001937_2_SI_NGA_ILE_001]|uniref:MFS transporter n=1 Tax=Pseudomonas sp. DTU_2021_1001937_2_SI_NGA_ILE_001 TaxID=3077589 RepID=UPI0028FC23A5|nr:MFS transporter [Pseudomonas sp. DTU_2021_1001937_2_SI_NGA_ILE_001]WNW10978.1 MFS transporter [Pseudomonas sp. DTU_2021_1001937_2_SI_NGA_ILE_001]